MQTPPPGATALVRPDLARHAGPHTGAVRRAIRRAGPARTSFAIAGLGDGVQTSHCQSGADRALAMSRPSAGNSRRMSRKLGRQRRWTTSCASIAGSASGMLQNWRPGRRSLSTRCSADDLEATTSARHAAPCLVGRRECRAEMTRSGIKAAAANGRSRTLSRLFALKTAPEAASWPGSRHIAKKNSAQALAISLRHVPIPGHRLACSPPTLRSYELEWSHRLVGEGMELAALAVGANGAAILAISPG